MQKTLFRKIAAGMIAVAMLGLTAGPVLGQTPEEQARQIEELSRLLTETRALLQAEQARQAGQPAAPATHFQFTRNLHLGVRGDDVVALQEYLRGTGHFPVGQAATGFFGPVTQRAVAAWQTANNVSPAAGFFGPLSRARYNELMRAVPTPTPTPAPTPTPEPTPTPAPTPPPLQGAEGSFRSVTQLFDVTAPTLREGEADRRVLGLEFEAAGSDLRVERVDAFFVWNTGAGSSNRPWRYFESVGLYRGTERIASRPAASSGDWSDEGVVADFGNARAYRMSFTGLSEVVRQGSRLPLYVGVTVRSTLDTADTTAEWLVRIPANGIRAVDATGINQFTPVGSIGDTLRFATAVTGTLTLSRDGTLNRDRVQRVETGRDTPDVEVLNFTMRAADAGVRVTSLTATTTHTIGGGSLAHGARRFSLVRNAAVIRTVTAPAATGTQPLVFSDLNFTIPAGTTDSFVIRMDARDTEGTAFVNGNTVRVTAVGVTAEDPVRGATVTATGTVSGGTIAFFDRGIGVALIDRTATASVAGVGGRDSASFVIRFRVNAFGADAHVLDGAGSGVAVTGVAALGTGDGALYRLITDPATATTTIAATLSQSLVAAAGDAGVNSNFIVRDGQTRDFTLTVGATATGPTGSVAFARIGLSQLHWAHVDQAISSLIFTHGLGTADWETAPVELRVR